jgi:hypothetical protein
MAFSLFGDDVSVGARRPGGQREGTNGGSPGPNRGPQGRIAMRAVEGGG